MILSSHWNLGSERSISTGVGVKIWLEATLTQILVSYKVWDVHCGAATFLLQLGKLVLEKQHKNR